MEDITEIHRRYCDACGKLIYEKDISPNSNMYGKRLKTDFYEVTFLNDADKSRETMLDKRRCINRNTRTICSESCIYKTVMPVYFAKIASKRQSKNNIVGIRISHIDSV